MRVQRWPGNVRQLKNIVDQLALFYAGEQITHEQLADLLHSDSDLLPTTRANDDDDHRKMMWQLVMALRHETDMLRQRIDAMESGNGRFSILKDMTASPMAETPPVTSLIKYPEQNVLNLGPNPLVESERATIAALLAKNGGNKKQTAEDLNISLRTLYRKLHELEIE